MGFDPHIFDSFDKDWALVTAGSIEHFNTMTISWGGLGTLWGLPVATVYVRPSRYTHEFLDSNEFFTVSFYPELFRKDLGVLGSKSGRDCDKVALTSLTPKAIDGSVTFEQAEQTLLCRKIYRQDMDPEMIPAAVKKLHYMDNCFHTIYIGEVIRMIGLKK